MDADLGLPTAVAAQAAASPIPLVQSIGNVLKNVSVLRGMLDRSFVSRQIPVAVFNAMAMSVKTSRELNTLYWRDTASTVKAYALSSAWRLIELIEQAVRLLHSDGVLGPAILSRSLVELTAGFILNGGSIREVVALAAQQWHEDKFVACEDLENLLNKALYGSRLVPDGDPLRQTNIVTQLQKLSKFPGWEGVMEHYERLCEVAHPNFLGHARFWADGPQPQADGSLLWSGASGVVNEAVRTIQADTLWSVASAGANVCSGFKILDDQVKIIVTSFPEERRSPTNGCS